MAKTPKPISARSALSLAIFALKDYRRKHHAIGHNAFILGQVFIFNERDHEAYEKLTGAINFIENLIQQLDQIPTINLGKKRKS